MQELWMPSQRYRPVLMESFVEGLHSRGIDVDAVRIEPGASPAASPAANIHGDAEHGYMHGWCDCIDL